MSVQTADLCRPTCVYTRVYVQMHKIILKIRLHH